MKLQDEAGSERDVGIVCVDCIKEIPVASDFLLGAIPRRCLFCNQIPNALQGNGDPF